MAAAAALARMAVSAAQAAAAKQSAQPSGFTAFRGRCFNMVGDRIVEKGNLSEKAASVENQSPNIASKPIVVNASPVENEDYDHNEEKLLMTALEVAERFRAIRDMGVCWLVKMPKCKYTDKVRADVDKFVTQCTLELSFVENTVNNFSLTGYVVDTLQEQCLDCERVYGTLKSDVAPFIRDVFTRSEAEKHDDDTVKRRRINQH
jgi:hypothetical protein